MMAVGCRGTKKNEKTAAPTARVDSNSIKIVGINLGSTQIVDTIVWERAKTVANDSIDNLRKAFLENNGITPLDSTLRVAEKTMKELEQFHIKKYADTLNIKPLIEKSMNIFNLLEKTDPLNAIAFHDCQTKLIHRTHLKIRCSSEK